MPEVHNTAAVPYSGEEHGQIKVPIAELMVDGQFQIHPVVLSKGYFTIRLDGNQLLFAAGKYVGRIPVNERVTIEVRPRVPVSGLTRMLAISGVAPRSLDILVRPYATSGVRFPSLPDLFAGAMVAALHDVEAQGVYREYANRREETSFPKGRVLLGETIRRHQGRGEFHRVSASWFDRHANNAPNQLLKYAVWYLAQLLRSPGQPRAGVLRLREQLNAAYAMFPGVSLWNDRRFLRDPLVEAPERMPALRSYYVPAMRLALAILGSKGLSFDLPGSDVGMPSLLLDLEKIFEAYLRNVLRRELAGAASLSVLDGNQGGPAGAKKALFDDRLPDSPPSEPATPDIVLRRRGDAGENVLVIEVKYKPYKQWPERDDLNQVIAYALSYQCPVAVLAHPWRGAVSKGLRGVGRMKDLAVYCYAVDLSAGDLLREEEAFGRVMRELVPPHPGASGREPEAAGAGLS